MTFRLAVVTRTCVGDRAASPGFGGLEEMTFRPFDLARRPRSGVLLPDGDAFLWCPLRDLRRVSSLRRLDLRREWNLPRDLVLEPRFDPLQGDSNCSFSCAPAIGAVRRVPSHLVW